MNKVDYTREWRHRNPDKVRIHNSTRYAKNRESTLKAHKIWATRNKLKLRAYQHQWHLDTYNALKIQVFTKYGGKCMRCGIDDIRVLCVDHVNGGGYRELSKKRGSGYYRIVLADTTGKYQILCHNCNWIKRFERREVRKPK